jgi:hypothetical protein
VITHKADDEKSRVFRRLLFQSDPEKALVTREMAVFVCRIVLAEVLRYRAAGVKVEFKDDSVRLADMFALLEQSVGAAGWQLMQRRCRNRVRFTSRNREIPSPAFFSFDIVSP